MTNFDESATSPSDVFGARLRHLRKQKRLSVEALAVQCKEVGSPELTANAIYSIENGRRKDGVRTRHVTVEELLALACALEVTPLGLLLPTDPGDYLVVSDRAVDSGQVFDWLGGNLNSPFGGAPVAIGEYPAGLPEWLLERLRKLNSEEDEALLDLSELRTRSTALLAEIEQKHAQADARIATFDELRADLEAELAELKEKNAKLDAQLLITGPTDTEEFKRHVTKILREELDAVIRQRNADS